jgi:hypothetical protein
LSPDFIKPRARIIACNPMRPSRRVFDDPRCMLVGLAH